MVFANSELRGYWPTTGDYTPDGTILPGIVYALDLQKSHEFRKMGEIYYDQGPESLDNSDRFR